MLKALISSAIIFLSGNLFAGICKLHYNRTACKGQEGISYKKCDGKKECDELEKAASLQDCRKLALNACENSRLEITKSKIVTAIFDNAPIKAEDGSENFCKPDRADFNKCE